MRFFHLVRAGGRMDLVVFFVDDFFHTVQPIEIEIENIPLFEQNEELISFWYISAHTH